MPILVAQIDDLGDIIGGIPDSILQNADKITVEILILVIFYFVFRAIFRMMSSQAADSKHDIEERRDLRKLADKQQETLNVRLESVEDRMETLTQKIIDDLTKPGSSIHTMLEQNKVVVSYVQNFARLVPTIPTGILGIRGDGTVISANKIAVDLLGIAPERMVGTNINDWRHDDLLAEDRVTNIPSEQFPVHIAFREKRVSMRIVGFWNPKRNERLWLMVRAEPSFDSEGKLSRVVLVLHDVGVLMNVTDPGEPAITSES